MDVNPFLIDEAKFFRPYFYKLEAKDFNLKKINLIKRIKGNPCNKVSNQSMGFIPAAPPIIQFNLPAM